MISFDEILKRYNRTISRDMLFSKEGAQGLFLLVREYYNEHPDATREEIHQFFQDEFLKESKALLRNPTVRTETIKHNTCRYLIDNPDEIRTAYEKIAREEASGKKVKFSKEEQYSSNRLSSIRKLIVEVLELIRREKGKLSEEDRVIAGKLFGKSFFPGKENRLKALKAKSKDMFEYYRMLFEGTEADQVEKCLKKIEPDIADNLRENYITILEFLGESLDRYGFLTKNCIEQERLYKRLGFSGLENSLEDDSQGTSVRSFFKRDVLERQETTTLSYLVVFWMNRYTKMIDDLNRTLFMTNQLGLWEKIRDSIQNEQNGNINLEIDESVLRTLYEKIAILDYLNAESIKIAKKIGNNEIVVDDITTTKVLNIDVTPAVNMINSCYGSRYCEYFYGDPKLAESEDEINPFIRDLGDFRILRNVLRNGYKMKDMNLIGLLSNLMYTQPTNNWGIMAEDNKNARNSSKILIGVDVFGLNMPLRVHADKEDIIDFCKASQGNAYMPIYEGEKDFRIMGENIGTPILMPLSLKQRSAIKKLSAEQMNGSDKKRFLSHLEYLENSSKYPEHLKVERTQRKKGKSKTIKVIPERRYIDLETGE